VTQSDMIAWMDECLEKTGPNFNRALQDIVNSIGERLGFTVEYGLYAGKTGSIGFDGRWVSHQTSIELVIETKKSEAYKIDPNQIGGYIEQLNKDKKEGGATYGIFAIGEEEPSTIVNTIRGSEYRNQIRVVPLKLLLTLLKMKEDVGLGHEQIVKLLVPIDTINIGEIIKLIESIVKTKVEEETIETPKRRIKSREELPLISREELSKLEEGDVVICPSAPEGIDFLLRYNAWGFVRINERPKYFSLYVSALESKIMFFGEVDEILDPKDPRSPIASVHQEYEYDEGKKLINLKAGSLKTLSEAIPKGSKKGKVPQGLRYISLKNLAKATTLDEL